MKLYVNLTEIDREYGNIMDFNIFHYVVDHVEDQELADGLAQRRLSGVVNAVLGLEDDDQLFSRLRAYVKTTLDPYCQCGFQYATVKDWTEMDYVSINIVAFVNH